MTQDFLTNHTLDALQPGDAASPVRAAECNDVDRFEAVSGDVM
ncbi:hypothetical protein RLW55_10240 [Hyphomicrobium sp. B1]|uniref:Uncharacterized protein n=1 Tax=Chelatococcus caeni TaxID=1348468 RepID=A0A840C8U4_9HYPH|nr:hypothetical protein [Chelatococcus caeni]MBB4020008.1 hypothetical protein [Chelatococcus caeni]